MGRFPSEAVNLSLSLDGTEGGELIELIESEDSSESERPAYQRP